MQTVYAERSTRRLSRERVETTHGRELPSGTLPRRPPDVEGSTCFLDCARRGVSPLLGMCRLRVVCEWYQEARRARRSNRPAMPLASRPRPRARRGRGAAESVSARRQQSDGLPTGAHRPRMNIYMGELALGEEGDVGMDVVVAWRICAAADGEQVVVSRATRDMAGEEALPARRSASSAAIGWRTFRMLCSSSSSERRQLRAGLPPLKMLSATKPARLCITTRREGRCGGAGRGPLAAARRGS